MQILSNEFINKWMERIINIHPSYLPAFKGLNAQAQAINSHATYSGCTVHFVNEKIDGGEIIEQQSIPINNDDTIFSLYKKAFCIAPYLIVKALETLEAGRINFPLIDTKSGSYFSSPSIKDIIRFRKLGKHFI